MRGIKTIVTKSNNSCVCQKRDLLLFSKFKTFINMKLMVTFISFSTSRPLLLLISTILPLISTYGFEVLDRFYF